MKSMFFILALFAGFSLSAQDITANVARAIESGQAAKLKQYIGDSVDLLVKDKEGTYNASQAYGVLNDFFSSHGVVSFKIMHKGTSKLNDEYRIGDLLTKQGTFRVTFFVHKTAKGMKIKQLRIESFDGDDF